MMPLVFALVGALLSAWASPLAGAVLGFLLGLVWKRLDELGDTYASSRDDFVSLRERHESLERQVRSLGATERSAPPVHPRESPAPPSAPAAAPVPRVQPPPLPAPVPEPALAAAPLPPGRPAAPPEVSPAGSVPQARPAGAWLIEFFTTGNVVAKAGMIVVFFGVGFLIRYAADQGLLPIEYRLMAAATGAMALLALGWRLRHSRPEYAMVLQGGAIGVLYLTIFAAFRLYGLLPATLTFALLLVVVVVSGVLAVVQDALSLAVLGTSGGFLAPILASTGAGSHVALFSYYAVLNAGVLGVAWFRSWRFLNWLAFVFTFGIGFVWGQEYYRPELFATTEPFLVGFFLLFLSLAILFAHRQPPELRGFIDSSLVFGLPAVAFGMQSVLVREIPFGRAYSAVALSALYLALARSLWRRDAALRPLTEAFLALAAVFLILAVPLAFDGHATAAAWALEGTGLVWIGIRQNRVLARLAGSALLVAAGAAFAVMAAATSDALPALNSRFLGSLMIAAGSIVAARLWSTARAELPDTKLAFEWALLVWGMLWWFGAIGAEVARYVQPPRFLSAALFAGAASAALLAVVARRLSWRALMLALAPLGPLLWMPAFWAFFARADQGPLQDLGWLGWSAVIASSYLLLFWFESIWPSQVSKVWHAGTSWLVIFLSTWTAAAAAETVVPEATIWSSAVWCIVPAVGVLFLLRAGTSPLSWPMRRHAALYSGPIAAAPVAAALVWVAWACARAGSPEPLPYVPLVNPLELTQAFGLLVGFAWWRRRVFGAVAESQDVPLRIVLAFLAFAALNMMVGRIVHFYLLVPFDFESLTDSYVFQAGISILWGFTAGTLMTAARFRLDRGVWMVGAGLLAMLILKLFVVDLRDVGGVARIVSFLATGVLILAIGYFAPAPPGTEKAS